MVGCLEPGSDGGSRGGVPEAAAGGAAAAAVPASFRQPEVDVLLD